MKAKKTIALLLCALTLTSALAACGDAGNAPAQTQAQSAASGETQTAEQQTTADDNAVYPEVKDLGGYNFRILCSADMNNLSGITAVWATEQTGEAVNDAIYTRDRNIEEKYNIKIEFIENAPTSISKSVKAGDDSCDITFPFVSEMFTMAQEGCLVDYAEISAVNLENPWWDQRIQENYSVGGRIFGMTGSYTLRNPMTEFVIQYNKQIYDNYSFDDPYEMVRNGSWTSEKFWDMAKQTSADLNGDGVMDANDMWGFITEITAPYYFFIGGGNRVLEQTEDGYRIALGDEKIVSALENSLFFAVDKQNALCVDDGSFKYTSATVWDEAYKMFTSNQSLFRSSALGDILEYRDMKMDYGILPIPKASEDQSEYYSLVSAWDDPMVIPVTVSDPEKTGLIIEALACASDGDVKDAFYDTLLSGKLMRDEQSVEMLDIVIKTKTYDLDWTVGITGVFNVLANIASSKKDTLSSTIAKIQDKSQAKLDKFLADFAD